MHILNNLNLVVQLVVLSVSMACNAMGPYIQSSTDLPHRSLQDSLINDPCSVFDQCSSLKTQFLRELDDQHVFDHQHMNPLQAARTFSQMCRMYTARNPIFLLGECTQSMHDIENTSMTGVRGTQNRFESVVAATAISAGTLRGSMVYTSFGTRRCFSDVRSLTLMLNRFSPSELAIHSIDALDRYYTGYKDMRFGSREVLSGEKWREPSSEEFNVLSSQVVDEVTEYFNPHVLNNYVREDLLLRLAQKKQMINWFRILFPRTTTRLFVHDCVGGYLRYATDRGMPLPDILVSSALDDEATFTNYKALVVTVLLRNKGTHNLLLNYEQGKPMIFSYLMPTAENRCEQGTHASDIIREYKIPLS
ncbi:hypothetical protein KJZ61_03735 [Candidatus Dependentiae bacterium]|nr:hypothetical protein [Candidatus Dependentiae bacterium]